MNDELERLMREATNRPWKMNTADKTGEDWLIASLGNSNEDGLDYIVTTDRVRASELDGDAKADAALIVAAVNALPGLLERVKRLEEALEFYAAREHYNDDPLPNNMWKTAKAVFDGGKRARAALSQEPGE